MILRTCEWHDVAAVGDADETRFFAGQTLLYDDRTAGITERAAGQHAAHGFQRLRDGARDDYTFAGRQTIRLDDDRRAAFLYVRLRLRKVREAPICRRRNSVTHEKLFCKRFRCLEPGSRARRRKTG